MEERTILFVDQVGSTAQLAAIGSEAMAAVFDQLWSIFRRAAADYGGSFISDEGDGGAMAFGEAPAAATAALRIAAEARESGLTVRCGLQTGDVLPRGSRFVGLPVHIAARLCSLAPDGHILTTEATQERLDETTARCTPFGSRVMKGIDDAVGVLLVTPADSDPPALDAVGAPTRVDVIASSPLLRGSGLFVGRADELQALYKDTAFDSAERHRLAVLAGEPGSGKSTLAQRFCSGLVGAGATCLVGRADEASDDPFHEFVEMLAHLVREAPAELLADHVLRYGDLLTRLLPGLGNRVPAAIRDGEPTVQADRRMLFDAITGLLEAASLIQPLVLLFEDLHWATAPSLDLIRHLLTSTHKTPITMVVTVRPSEIPPGSIHAALLSDLRAHAAVSPVNLEPFTEEQIAELVTGIVARLADERPDLVAALAKHLRAKTAGNPLFCAELLHQMDHEALKSAIDSGASTGQIIEQLGRVPATVHDLARRQVDRLGPDTASTLADAAVLGESFSATELASLAGPGHDILTALDAAERAGVIRAQDRDGYAFSFRHALVQEAIYDRQTTAERLRRHRQAADVFPPGPTQQRRAADRLRHLLAAGFLASPDEIADTASLAAEDAYERIALDETVQFYEIAAEAVEQAMPADQRAVSQTLLSLGRAQTAAGLQAGGPSLVRAAEAARQAGDWDLFAEIAVSYGGELKENQAEDDVSAPMALITKALENHLEPSDTRARLLTTSALWRRQFIPVAERLPLVDEAMAIARKSENPWVLAEVLAERHRALHGPPAATEALENAAELDVLAERLDNRQLHFQSANLQATALYQLGDWEGAGAAAARLRSLGNQLRNIEGQRLAAMWDTLHAMIEGRWSDASAHITTFREVIAGYPPAMTNRFLSAMGFTQLWMQGHLGFLYESVQGGDVRDSTLAWFAAETGHFDEAHAAFGRFGGVQQVVDQSDYMWSFDMVSFVRYARATDDRDVAAQIYDEMLPFRSHNAAMGLIAFIGSNEHHLGTLAAMLGRPDTAIEHYEAAIARHRGMKARPFLAVSLAEYANELRGRDLAGDAERADIAETESCSIADELDVQQVATELSRVQ